MRIVPTICLLLAAMCPIGGCRAHQPIPVRAVDSWPGLDGAYAQRVALVEAIDQSLRWLQSPHREADERLIGSLTTMRDLLQTSSSVARFTAAVRERFERHYFVGSPALLTGYFAPEYPANLRRTATFCHPLHRPPPDWSPGETWHPRREVVRDDLLAGSELVWFDDALNAYLVEVNGSARLRLPDGQVIHIGHAGTNNLPYTSLGRLLIDQGLADESEMSMQMIRRLHREQPDLVESLMLCNDRMVFFEVLDADAWPRSALGIRLTPGVSAATDHRFYPPAAMLLIHREDAPMKAELRLNQDQGGAIRGPARADLFIGIGPDAGGEAGRLVAPGRIELLLLREGARMGQN